MSGRGWASRHSAGTRETGRDLDQASFPALGAAAEPESRAQRRQRSESTDEDQGMRRGGGFRGGPRGGEGRQRGDAEGRRDGPSREGGPLPGRGAGFRGGRFAREGGEDSGFGGGRDDRGPRRGRRGGDDGGRFDDRGDRGDRQRDFDDRGRGGDRFGDRGGDRGGRRGGGRFDDRRGPQPEWPEGVPTRGIVVSTREEFGFLRVPGVEDDVFYHISEVAAEDHDALKRGTEVAFRPKPGRGRAGDKMVAGDIEILPAGSVKFSVLLDAQRTGVIKSLPNGFREELFEGDGGASGAGGSRGGDRRGGRRSRVASTLGFVELTNEPDAEGEGDIVGVPATSIIEFGAQDVAGVPTSGQLFGLVSIGDEVNCKELVDIGSGRRFATQMTVTRSAGLEAAANAAIHAGAEEQRGIVGVVRQNYAVINAVTLPEEFKCPLSQITTEGDAKVSEGDSIAFYVVDEPQADLAALGIEEAEDAAVVGDAAADAAGGAGSTAAQGSKKRMFRKQIAVRARLLPRGSVSASIEVSDLATGIVLKPLSWKRAARQRKGDDAGRRGGDEPPAVGSGGLVRFDLAQIDAGKLATLPDGAVTSTSGHIDVRFSSADLSEVCAEPHSAVKAGDEVVAPLAYSIKRRSFIVRDLDVCMPCSEFREYGVVESGRNGRFRTLRCIDRAGSLPMDQFNTIRSNPDAGDDFLVAGDFVSFDVEIDQRTEQPHATRVVFIPPEEAAVLQTTVAVDAEAVVASSLQSAPTGARGRGGRGGARGGRKGKRGAQRGAGAAASAATLMLSVKRAALAEQLSTFASSPAAAATTTYRPRPEIIVGLREFAMDESAASLSFAVPLSAQDKRAMFDAAKRLGVEIDEEGDGDTPRYVAWKRREFKVRKQDALSVAHKAAVEAASVADGAEGDDEGLPPTLHAIDAAAGSSPRVDVPAGAYSLEDPHNVPQPRTKVVCNVVVSMRTGYVCAASVRVAGSGSPAAGGAGDSSPPAGRERGTVVRFQDSDSFGFVQFAGRSDKIFFHISAVRSSGAGGAKPRLRRGTPVEFSVELDAEGRTMATDVEILPPGTLPAPKSKAQVSTAWYRGVVSRGLRPGPKKGPRTPIGQVDGVDGEITVLFSQVVPGETPAALGAPPKAPGGDTGITASSPEAAAALAALSKVGAGDDAAQTLSFRGSHVAAPAGQRHPRVVLEGDVVEFRVSTAPGGAAHACDIRLIRCGAPRERGTVAKVKDVFGFIKTEGGEAPSEADAKGASGAGGGATDSKGSGDLFFHFSNVVPSLDAIVFNPKIGEGVADGRDEPAGDVDGWTPGAPPPVTAGQVVEYTRCDYQKPCALRIVVSSDGKSRRQGGGGGGGRKVVAVERTFELNELLKGEKAYSWSMARAPDGSRGFASRGVAAPAEAAAASVDASASAKAAAPPQPPQP